MPIVLDPVPSAPDPQCPHTPVGPEGSEVNGDVFGADPVTKPITVAGAIEQAALDGVSSVTVDATTTVRMNVRDQIAADQYAGAKRAARLPMGGLRVARIVGNSAV